MFSAVRFGGGQCDACFTASHDCLYLFLPVLLAVSLKVTLHSSHRTSGEMNGMSEIAVTGMLLVQKPLVAALVWTDPYPH